MHAILKRMLFFIATSVKMIDVLLSDFGHYRIDGARAAKRGPAISRALHSSTAQSTGMNILEE